MTRRTSVFLGGWLNVVNAQNLNCLALARHLDKEKFTVLSMLHPRGDMAFEPIDGVRVFKCRRPMRLCQYLVYLWGISKADVAYLPKGEVVGFNRFLLKLFKRKSFITVEGVIAGFVYDQKLAALGSEEAIFESYSFTDETYSITKFMADYHQHSLGIRSDGVLYLGVESESFAAYAWLLRLSVRAKRASPAVAPCALRFSTPADTVPPTSANRSATRF